MSPPAYKPLPSEDLTAEEQLAANNAQIAVNNARIRELEAEQAALELAAINGRIALMESQIEHDKAAIDALAAAM